MALVMMAMCPMKSRAQSDPTQVSNENYTTLGLTDAYVGYYAITNAEDLAWVQNKVERLIRVLVAEGSVLFYYLIHEREDLFLGFGT